MKKLINLLLKKINHRLNFCFLITILLFNSCKKETVKNNFSNTKTDFYIWYDNYKASLQDTINLFGSLKPDFTNAQQFFYGGNTVLEIPMLNSNTILGIKKSSNLNYDKIQAETVTKLLLFKTSSNEIFGGYMLLNGTASKKISDLSYGNFEDFTGTVSYFSLDNILTNYYIL